MPILAVVIKLPAQAFVPLMIGVGVLLVLLFGGVALAEFQRKRPREARIVGIVLGLICSASALYKLANIFPQVQERDPIHTGVELISMFDAPICGFIAMVGVIMWGWAKQPWVALGFGAVVGGALLIKPFVAGLVLNGMGSDYPRSKMDLEHLVFYAAGVVVLIATWVVFARRAAKQPVGSGT